jgi:Peptidase family S41
MTVRKTTIFTIITVLVHGIAFSQNSTMNNDKILTKKQAIEDYNILYSSLTNYHPNPFLYVAENDFKTFYETQITNISDTISELEFHYLSRQLISQIKCGHTFAKPSKEWYTTVTGKNVQLPFDVKNIENRLFISNTINDTFQFNINDELISINNIKVADILYNMSLMQERDGFTESFSKALIEKRFRTYILFIMGVQTEYFVEYKTNLGEIQTTTVFPTNKKLKDIKKTELPSNFKKIIGNNWSVFSFDSMTNLAYLKIDNFSDRKEFKNYYQSVFKFLKQKGNAKLIVDLRDNPGGDFRNGNNFLTYLTPNNFELNFHKPQKIQTENEYVELSKWVKWTKIAFGLKPSKHKINGKKTDIFTYKPSKYLFDGKINVITNGLTFSQASLVAAHLKEYGAVFFGQETGGAEMGCNGILNYDLVLPNSKLAVTIPMYQVKSNSTKGQIGYGVKPNYQILPTLDNSIDNTLIEVVNILIGEK